MNKDTLKKILKNTNIFIILLIISSLIYWNYLSMHYATDTYNIMNIGYEKYAQNNSLSDGRFFMYLIGKYAATKNIPITTFVTTLTFFAIFISCGIVILLKEMLLKYKRENQGFLNENGSNNKPIDSLKFSDIKGENLPQNSNYTEGSEKKSKIYKFFQELIVILISYATIFNFMYVENLYFVESAVMALSILLYLVTVKIVIEKSNYYYIKALFVALLATFCYQGTIGLLVVFGLLFSLIKNKNKFSKTFKDFWIFVSIAGIAFVANLIQIGIATAILETQQKRLNGIQNLIENVIYLIVNFNTMIFQTIFVENCGLFSNYLMLIFMLICLSLGIVQELKSHERNIFLNLSLLIILILAVTFAMCIVSITSYDTGRIHLPVGAMVGIMFIYLYCNSSIFDKNSALKYIAILVLVIYNILLVVNTISLTYQHKKVNELEQSQMEGLEAYIENYEKQTGKKVTEARYFKLSKMKDRGYFKSISNKSVLTYDGAACTWSAIGTINFYTGRNFADNYLEAIENLDTFYSYYANRSKGYESNYVIMNGILYFMAYI